MEGTTIILTSLLLVKVEFQLKCLNVREHAGYEFPFFLVEGPYLT